MDKRDNIDLEMEESLSVRVEEPVSDNKNTVYLWLRRIFTFDVEPNEKHYYPVFIIFMSSLHIFIHLLISISNLLKVESFSRSLYDLGMLYLPCMRPTFDGIRLLNVTCGLQIQNTTCYYDDIFKEKCSSFMYPHQLWRMITVNLLHINWLHLSFNVSKQLLYGIPLERKYGSIRIIIIYWLCDLSASLTYIMVNRHRHASGIGASGALYGILLFFIVERLIAMKTNIDHHRCFFIVIQLVLLVIIPTGITISTIIIFQLRVAHSAHFGGGLMGFLFGIGMFGCPWPWNDGHCICQRTCRQLAIAFLSLYFLMTVTIFFLINAPSASWILYRS